MYKVLHVIAKMDRGGAETFIMNVLRNIDLKEYHFDFLLNSSRGDYVEEIEAYGCKIYVLPSRNKGYFKYVKYLKKFFKSYSYDAIHMHVSSLSSIEPLMFAKINTVPNIIIHSHSTNQEGLIHKLLHYINKPLIKFVCTKYVTCSNSAADWLYSNTGIIPDNIVLLNNGIVSSRYIFDEHVRADYRKKFAISDETIVLSHIGRFDENKNQKFVVDVFREYHLSNPNSILLFFGRGNTENMIKEYVINNKLERNVIFAGVRNDIDKCLQALDFLIFPSHYEGLPVTLIEAQASGLYIFASDRVSKEAHIAECFTSMSLDDSPYEWSQRILNCKYPNRVAQNRYVKDKGYDIQSTIYLLENEIYK